jgi:hypothetical protein
MRLVRNSWLAVPLVFFAACSNTNEAVLLDPDPEAAAVVTDRGRTFELRPGQVARVGNAGLLVGFRGIATDSRCPIDVVCVWQGDAEARVPVTIGRRAWTALALHTGIEPHSAVFEGYTVTLVSVAPAPRSDQRISPDRYVATLRVE